MNNITVIKVYKPDKYNLRQRYGILKQSMQDTALINFSGNTSGLCVNIAHSDYGVVSPDYWDILNGEVVVTPYGGYIRTGLMIN